MTRAAAFVLACAIACACQPAPSGPTLSEQGYGDMRIGMPIAEARQVSGQALDAPALEEGVPGACSEQSYRTADGDQLWLMFEGDVITRITANDGSPNTHTAENIGVGSTDAEVRAAYPNAIEEGSHYNEPPAHNLIVWTVPDQSGMLFEVNEQGIVTNIHAGAESILYMEGCA